MGCVVVDEQGKCYGITCEHVTRAADGVILVENEFGKLEQVGHTIQAVCWLLRTTLINCMGNKFSRFRCVLGKIQIQRYLVRCAVLRFTNDFPI